ncbi:MAG: PPC domain-containing protein [Cyanobacteria bacterium J06638_20]
MSRLPVVRLDVPLLVAGTSLTLALSALSARADLVYNPIPMPDSNTIVDTLSDVDIPTGNGGFARDYLIELEAGDQVVMDLSSEQFDTIITLIAPDGTTIGQNDDGPDGTTNSLLFARITQTGNYVLRVSPFAGQGLGQFTLSVTRLRPVDEP